PQRPPDPMVYVPLLQMADYKNPTDISYQNIANTIRTIQLRVSGKPSDLEGNVRRTLASINPNLTVLSMLPLSEQVGISYNNSRVVARITTLYGLLALVVASVGVY